jgi:uncharacterized protein YqeY
MISARMLKQRLLDDMKAAMKGGDKPRLGVIRLINAAIKQHRGRRAHRTRRGPQVLAVLEKMVKQRRDSQAQYEDAGRAELAAQEAAEIAVIQEFLPAQLSDDELDTLIDEAIAAPRAPRACRPWAR